MRPPTRFLESFRYAGRGMRETWRTQRNLRVQVLVGLVIIALGWWVGVNSLQWAVLVLTMGLVLGLEMLNRAVEALGDAVTDEDHPLVGKAKDAGAGAVLMAAVAAVIVGLLILGPPLWQRLFGPV